MPTTAKGTNIFHASQAVIGADGDLDDPGSNGGSADQDRPQTPDNDAPAHDSVTPHRDMVLDAKLARSWPITPPPAPSAQSPPFKRSHKQNHSAITSTVASSISTTPSASTSRKKSRTGVMSNAEALVGLRSQLAVFSGTFLEGTSLMAAPPPLIAPSPSRKTKAIQQAQELELDLDDEKLVSLIRIFQADVNAADAYMVLKREGVWKLWIESTLSAL